MRVKLADGSGIFHFYVNLVTKRYWDGLQLVSGMVARAAKLIFWYAETEWRVL
jgi:hypothetical protein